MWTCRCTLNTCTRRSFLLPLPHTHIHPLRLCNFEQEKKWMRLTFWVFPLFTSFGLDPISSNVMSGHGHQTLTQEEFKWHVSFHICHVTYQLMGFQRDQFILQTSPHHWLTWVPMNWAAKLMGCLLPNKFSTCYHHDVTECQNLSQNFNPDVTFEKLLFECSLYSSLYDQALKATEGS